MSARISAKVTEVRTKCVVITMDEDTARHFLEALGNMGSIEDIEFFGSASAGVDLYDALYEALNNKQEN